MAVPAEFFKVHSVTRVLGLSLGQCADTHGVEQEAWADLRPYVTVITAWIALSSWNAS
jgi:hypothetical protein